MALSKENTAPSKVLLNKKLASANSKIRMSHYKLDALLEITKAVNANFSKEQLFEKFEIVLKTQLDIGKLALFSFDSEWKCELSYGVKRQFINIEVERDLLKFNDITSLASTLDLQPFDFVIPVYHKESALAFVLIGDFDEEKLEVSPIIKHLPFIQTLTNIIIVAVENKKLAKDNLRQEVLRKELEFASDMQSMLFPSSLPNNMFIDVAATYIPHRQVGGDYYDFIKLNENEYLFCIADVSGKGIPAALLMSNFQANLRALLNYSNTLSDLVNELNSKVSLIAKGEKFITLFIAKYNVVTRVLNYVNAGHLPPILVFKQSLNLLRVGCAGIGMLDELPKVFEGVINIPSGATLVCYTDGATEVENKNSEHFELERLSRSVLHNSKLTPYEINRSIISEVENFSSLNDGFQDDIALLTIKFK